MKTFWNDLSRKNTVIIFILLLILQNSLAEGAQACACGCGIFDVGTSLMLPNSTGGMVYLEYDTMNQNKNWHAANAAPADGNPDKDIKTSYVTLGGQYFFNRNYGVQIDVPLVVRHYESVDDDGNFGAFDKTAIGDIRLKGIYTGFSEDMTTGLIFGLKLPTGPTLTPGFDFDTDLGTGSTDLLLGLFHLQDLSSNHLWTAFSQVLLNEPVLTENDYIPGNELDAVYGVYYHGLTLSPQSNLVPMLEVKASFKASDHGMNGDEQNTGYTRLMVTPALEANIGALKLYVDVSVPFYQYFVGNQLTPDYLLKTMVAYYF
jgi:hypothetical protein